MALRRSHHLSHRRHEYPPNGLDYDDEEEPDEKDYRQLYVNRNDKLKDEIKIENLSQYMRDIKSHENEKQIIGITSIGMLMIIKNKGIIIESEILSLLLEFITVDSTESDSESLKSESLSFIAISNEHILLELVENHDIIQSLYKLVQTTSIKNNKIMIGIISALYNLAKQKEAWKNQIISVKLKEKNLLKYKSSHI